ncbi:Epoxyqueuosine (oQ) reductase QueG [hydrothermal vent metagenome]|uniref:Epoxyqueuosine (OQ) reductase QueG n=1 Tax=hydrothermal vent metagenome TaxID=652676 RepID=A0A3B0SNP7_9ZZZZ
MDLRDDLVSLAAAHAATIGVTDLAPFPEVGDEMRARIDAGSTSKLGFTYKDVGVAAAPLLSFPWGRSIVVVAVGYLHDGDGPRDGRSVARFADGDRYHTLTTILGELAEHLDRSGYRVEIVFDDDRLVDRAVAARAGVGWSGKSSMLLVPGHGPWVLLGSIVTDALLPRDEAMLRTCGTCDDCIPACPTAAIVAPGVIDARRCLAAIFQSRGDIPREVRTAAGGRIYGCDDCLTSCPPGARDLESRSVEPDAFTALDLLGMSDRELAASVAHWYVPGRRMRFLRRNALVALGNTGSETAVPVILGYLGHPDAMLRRHAAWSLGVLAPDLVGSIRDRLVATEQDDGVRRELDAACA